MKPIRTVYKRMFYVSVSILFLLLFVHFFTEYHSLNIQFKHFLGIHTIFELCKVFVALIIILHSWMIWRTEKRHDLFWLGTFFFGMIVFDFLHIWSYQNMNYEHHTSSRTLLFWVTARLTGSIGVLLYTLKPKRLPFNNHISLVFIILICSIIVTYYIMIHPYEIARNWGFATELRLTFLYSTFITINIVSITILVKKYLILSRKYLLDMATAMLLITVGALSFTTVDLGNHLEEIASHVLSFAGYFFLCKAAFYTPARSILTDKFIAETRLFESEQKLFEIQKSMSRHIFNAHEQERKKISSDLHDGVGQYLYSIMMMVNHSTRNISNQTKEEDLQKIKDVALEALQEVKGIAYSLRPRMLDDLGLVPALKSYADRYQEVYQIPVILTVNGNLTRLDPEIETNLYRICQEALTNIAKYANASEVSISLLFTKESISLSIKDNGIGFRHQETMNNPGLGLYSMKERAESMSGFFSLSSELEEGTTIFVQIPLHENKS